jgi:hypothetical protein
LNVEAHMPGDRQRTWQHRHPNGHSWQQSAAVRGQDCGQRSTH